MSKWSIRESGKRRDKQFVLSTAITLAIVAMLVISNPAQAVQVNINAVNLDDLQVGEAGYFYVNITIGANERIPINNISIEGLPSINGSPDGTLVFNISDFNNVGDFKIKGNYNISSIEQYGLVSDFGYGYGYDDNKAAAPYSGYGYEHKFYGYGYGYGYDSGSPTAYTKLVFKIMMDTTGAEAKQYNLTVKVNAGNDAKEQNVVFQSSFKFTLQQADVPDIINAAIKIRPETLNIASKGKFTAYISLPEGYDEADINLSTVEGEGAHAVSGKISKENGGTLIVKFNRQDLTNVQPGNNVKMNVTGNLFDGTPFEGNDTVRVIDKGKGNVEDNADDEDSKR